MDENSNNLRNQIRNKVDMLEGCKNRMCITDDEEELASLFSSAAAYMANLFTLNLKRIRKSNNLPENQREKMVKPVDDYGELRCPDCNAVIICDDCGDMPDKCPGCGKDIDYSDFTDC